MKRFFTLFFSGLFIFAVVGFIAEWRLIRNYFLLNWSDLVFAWDDNRDVALSHPDTNEEYYNRWLCFDAASADVSYGVVEYGEARQVPIIDIKSGTRTFQFNVGPEIEWLTAAVQNRWRRLLQNQDSVCIFSVYSETDPDGTEVRYIRKLKTPAGVWDVLDKGYTD